MGGDKNRMLSNGRLLRSFLNIEWLRPKGVWDAIAAYVLANCGYAIESPSLDLGAGNVPFG